jgi:hypothetical protein
MAVSRWRRMARQRFQSRTAKKSKRQVVIPGIVTGTGLMVFWGEETDDGHPIFYAAKGGAT